MGEEEKFVKVKKSDLVPVTVEDAKKWRQLWWRKLFENFVSVKVWVIFALLFVSAVLCYQGKVTSEGFVAVNGTVISIVFGLREGFKVAKVRNGNGDEKTWV